MHQVVIDRWSRRSSAVHRVEPRVKLVALGVFLVCVATTAGAPPAAGAAYFALLAAAILWAGLPLRGVLARSAVVLPFSAAFAAVAYAGGNGGQAVPLVVKSYLSATAVLLVVATTPLERFARAMEALGTPRLIALVVQFLYRYLFVISEQAQHMRVAVECRAPRAAGAARRERFRAAAGAVGVLFARSYARAEGIHRAMLARGFSGQFTTVSLERPGLGDIAFLAAAVGLIVLIRVGVRT